MPYTGKATYSAGPDLPEIAEDVGDLVGVVTPHETPLLDALGDPTRVARSTVHEWLEDRLVPQNLVAVSAGTGNPATVVVSSALTLDAGDQLVAMSTGERLLVVSKTNNTTVVAERGYGGTTPGTLSNTPLTVLGNAALEGGAARDAAVLTRTRVRNYTQIFNATVDLSGSELAVKQLAVADELEWQKQLRLRELLRDLENTVLNGRDADEDPQGSATARRTMCGITGYVSTHQFAVGQNGFPSDARLTETQLNLALRSIWKASSGSVDLIVVGGREKRAMNSFATAARTFHVGGSTYRDLINHYESDYGTCRVVLCRHVPDGTVLLLDSQRIEVMPLSGRSFHYKPLASTGDHVRGQLVGEYTVEVRNEQAHGIITGFTA